MSGNEKITARHLTRVGYVYIRQSTAYQVMANTESTLRQYALKDRLKGLGWDDSLIKIIDTDLGISGKTTEARSGFQQLMADVANGKVGAVACIEASRLSRNSADWTRLISICSMTDTLLIDADGIYSPNDFNDSILLGLKGTMSEVELHYLQERMRGGLLNKARRGELKRWLPIGYEYDLDGKVIKTTDPQIRESVELLFNTFRSLKTGHAVMMYFAEHEILFPIRYRKRDRPDEIAWKGLNEERVINILHNPFYTGAYIYGRSQMQWTDKGRRQAMPVPEEKWHVNIANYHEAYISAEEFALNQDILFQNYQPFKEKVNTAPREGAALLQGICYCGRCGSKMHVQYRNVTTGGVKTARYICSSTHHEGPNGCRHSLPADPVDAIISEEVAKRLTPEVLAITAEVAEEVSKNEDDRLRYFQLQLDQAKYEVDMAKTRYMSVDPTNRLVANELESAWNRKLRALDEAQKKYAEAAAKGPKASKEELAKAICRITDNIQSIWQNPNVKNEDKKRIVRYLVRDVTINRKGNYKALVQIVFQGGATQTIEIDVPKPRYIEISTPKNVLEFLEANAEAHPYTELTEMLNSQGYTRVCGRPFLPKNVHRIMQAYGIRSMKQRYLDKGWLTLRETAERMGISFPALNYRVKHGLYSGEYVVVEDKGTFLFNPALIPL